MDTSLHWLAIWTLLPHVGFAPRLLNGGRTETCVFFLALACLFESQLMEAKPRTGLHALVAVAHGTLQLCAHRRSRAVPLLRACGLELAGPEGAGSLKCRRDPTNGAPAQPAQR